MIIDCFPFFNELDLLEIRLNELKGVVDKIVICESTTTHSGRPKELNYPKVADKYKEFNIEYIVHQGELDIDNAWKNEEGQRDKLIEGLTSCGNDDVIILSDIDEIPNPEMVKFFDDDGVVSLEMQPTYYYMNTLCTAKWYHGKIFKYQFIGDRSLSRVRLSQADSIISNGGLHSSYMGGTDKISYKLDSFAHQEFNNETYNNTESIQSKIDNVLDLYSGVKLKVVDPKKMSYFPSYVLENLDKFSCYINLGYESTKSFYRNKQ